MPRPLLFGLLVAVVAVGALALADFYMFRPYFHWNHLAVVLECEQPGRPAEVDRKIAACTSFIRSTGGDARAFYARGYWYAEKHDYARAKHDFDRTIALDPSNIVALSARGLISLNHGDYNDAIADYDRAALLAPQNAEALNDACWARAASGRSLPIALADCNKALAILPGNANMLQSRAFVYFRMGMFAEAIADCNASLTAYPRFSEALVVRGLAELREGRTAGGNADIAAAKALDRKILAEYKGYGVTMPTQPTRVRS